MNREQLTWLGETFEAIRCARGEAVELLADPRDGMADLALIAKAASLLRGLGQVDMAEEWRITLDAVYLEASRLFNLTPQEVQDYATTLNRMSREITDIGSLQDAA